MSADTFLQGLTQALFVLIFVVVTVKAVREPRRVTVDTALLFGATALIIVESWITGAVHVTPEGLLLAAIQSLLMILPYLLLRLLDDFAGVPRTIMRSATVGLLLSIVVLFIWRSSKLPAVLTLGLVLYFVALSVYVASTFVRLARTSSGITRRRMRAVAAGTACLGLVIVVAGLSGLVPSTMKWLTGVIGDCLGLACGISYFVGFAPPAWLRRAWQEPELRSFLGRAAALPRLPSTAEIVRELEVGAAASLGTGKAVIGLWNQSEEALEFGLHETLAEPPLVDSVARTTFETQCPTFSEDAARDYPEDAALYRRYSVNSVLAVPITVGDEKLGVLSVYAARAPIFAEDDLLLAQLLADQAAVILESRSLIDEAARVRAHEEATRLKDDFLSAAAHDLKTPLTAIIAQSQLLERRATRKPEAPPDLAGIQRMVKESQRLKRLVTELLDVGRVEQGKLLGRLEEVDLVALVDAVCKRHSTSRHRCRFTADEEAVMGTYDPVRIEQLVDNLVENAVKYSPDGGDVQVRLYREDGLVHLTVTDAGIGIPADDLPHLFDRFRRGTNVDDRRFAGMGLGLFICRGIAEQHGGRLWATSPGPGGGSTLHVELPCPHPAAAEAPRPEGELQVLSPVLASPEEPV